MDSRKHGTMEINEEHLTSNNLTYYTHETEQYAWSYDPMNRATYHEFLGTSRKLYLREKSTRHGTEGSRYGGDVFG